MKDFHHKYDTLIFDMDGVITAENAYWDAAALTVYEFLNSSEHFGDSDIDRSTLLEDISSVRNGVFLNGKLITLLKSKGVNSNWDLGYVTVLIALICSSESAEDIYAYALTIDEDIITAYDTLARAAADKTGESFDDYRRGNRLWCDMQETFQKWYLGDEKSGIEGVCRREEPIIPLAELKDILQELSRNKRLCVGTGRPEEEIVPLLKRWGVAELFESNGLCNYDYVVEAEKNTGKMLTKPHPYMFLKALYGLDYPDDKIMAGDYDKAKIKRTLVIGDAGADILAAQAMGADFCAVLTGVSGQAAREYFQNQKAEYILNDIRDLV